MANIQSVQKKINVKTLMGQTEALVENTELLKINVATLISTINDKNKIKPLPVQEEVPERKKIKPKLPKIGEFLKGGRLNLGGLLPLLKGLASIGLAVGGLAAAFAINPKSTLIRIGKSITKFLLKGISKLVKGLRKIIGGIGNAIKKTFNFFGDKIKALKNFIGDKIIKPIRRAFQSAIDSKWFKKLKNFFDNITDSIKRFFKKVLTNIQDFAKSIFNKIKTFVGDVVDSIFRGIRNVFDRFVNVIADTLKRISDNVLKPIQEKIAERISRATKILKERFKKFTTETIENINNIKTRVISVIQDTITGGIKFVFNGLKNAPIIKDNKTIVGVLNTAENVLIGLVNEPKKTIEKIFGDTKKLIIESSESAIQTGRSYIDSIKSTVGQIITNVDNFTKPARDTAKQFAATGKRVFGEVSADVVRRVQSVVDGVRKGYTSAVDGVKFINAEFKKASGATKEFLSNSLESIQKNLPTEKIKEGLSTVLSRVGDVVSGVKNSVVNMVGGGLRNATNPRNIMTFLGDTAQTVINPVKGFMEGTKNLLGKVNSFIDKLPIAGPFKRGFGAATQRFDALFELGFAAARYGKRISDYNSGKTSTVPAEEGLLESASIGNSLMMALSGFLGAGLGSAIGTSLGATIFPPAAPIIGGTGSILGGIIGEEIGKIISTQFAQNLSPDVNKDPFLEGERIFEPQDAFQGVPLLDQMDGITAETNEPEPPTGGIDGKRLKPVSIDRDFNLMEDYQDYGMEIFIVTKEKIVEKQVPIPVGGKSSGKLVPIVIGDDSLNTYKEVTLSKLAYN